MPQATVPMLQDSKTVLQILANLQKTWSPDMPEETRERYERLTDDLGKQLWTLAQSGDEIALNVLSAIVKNVGE